MTDPGPVTDPERRSRLLGVKLLALVAAHLGRPDASTIAETSTVPHGAAVVVDGAAWVLIEGPAARSLGGALAWAVRQGAEALHLVADDDTGTLARRASRFAFPIEVWFADERTLLPAVAEPLAEPVVARDEHLAFRDVIVEAGAATNVEHGVVVGEVRGLEVCRVVDEPTVGRFAELGDVDLVVPPSVPASPSPAGDDGSSVTLEVGVGANDREAFRMLHGDIPTVEALAAVVDSVRDVRSADAPQHPLNRLGQERYLRWRLEDDPTLVGMTSVVPTEPPLPRPNLKDPIPCVARAVRDDGTEHVLVCSVGVDLDLVGFVADVQATTDLPVTVVVPPRDHVAITADLVALLRESVDIVTVP